MVTGSKQLIRDINSHLVVELIINEGPISRAGISKKLGLTKATISNIVQSLLEQEFVVEIGSDDTSMGRKPILLSFNSSCGNIISIDLNANGIAMIVSDLKGGKCSFSQYPIKIERDTIIDWLIKIIKKGMNFVPVNKYGVVGISIAIHGVVDKNQITFAPYYPLEQLPIAEQLEACFEIPVYLENEANLSVLGEKTFCYHVPNVVGISVHSGIGLGIIINNKLYKGFNGNAGEFGHSIVEIDGRLCPCGNKGCFEQYASERVLLEEFARYKKTDKVTLDELVADYRKGKADAILIIEQFIKYMSIGINNILNVLNPNVIVMNSLLVVYLPEAVDKIKNQLRNRMGNHCQLVPSGLQDSAILLGGVCVCMNRFLEIEYLRL